MAEEKGNFKRAMFGGFDRKDVIDYIKQLAGEKEEREAELDGLREELQKLRTENDDLKHRLESERTEFNARIEAVNAETRTLKDKIRNQGAIYQKELAAQRENARSLAEKSAQESERVLEELFEKISTLKTDIGVNISNAKNGLKNVENALTASLDVTENAQKRIAAMREGLEKRNGD